MTVMVGHKRSRHLIEAEAYRRIMAGEAPATLEAFSEQLLAWLRSGYPDAAPMSAAAIEGYVRDTWHRRHDLIQGGSL